jgi:VirE N-terminal domain
MTSNNLKDILDSKVSYQKDTWTSLSKEMTINEVLDQIRNGQYSKTVQNLRDLLRKGDSESYKAEKLKLPAVTFCGTFINSRKKVNLKEYNNLIVLDIDKLTQEKLQQAVKDLENDKYVFAYWISPSNNGIKGLVHLNFKFECDDIDICHKNAFEKLSNYFLSTYDILLDASGNDTTRLCFLSDDPDLNIKKDSFQFEIVNTDIDKQINSTAKESKKLKVYNASKKNALYNPIGKNKNIEKREIKNIINFLTKKKIVITGEYEDRYKIAYAIANTFTYDIGVGFFLGLCKIEESKYNQQRENTLLEYCYENNTGWTKFSYIEELVKETGYIKRSLEKVVS